MIAVIILAAGASARLGQQKQALIFKGKTLLENAIETAVKAGCEPVVVVTSPEINVPEISDLKGSIFNVTNHDWETGMASSICAGIKWILKESPGVNASIIMVCDQPFVDTSVLNELKEAYRHSGNKIVACTYKNTAGVPALFDKSLFDELLQLKGDQGAKVLLHQHVADVLTISFPKGSIDIDTTDDYEKLVNTL